MTLILIIALPVVGGVAYGIWMASQFGLLSLRRRAREEDRGGIARRRVTP